MKAELELIAKKLYEHKGEGWYEILTKELSQLILEDKLELLGDLLCQEWFLNEHFEHIKKILMSFLNSLAQEGEIK